MANYNIIGGDGKQYGPITTDDLRNWIAEGRLNAQSQVKAEGDAEFRALSTFPEFAGALKTQTATVETAAPSAVPGDWLERDYELDIGGCVSQGWNLLKNNFGTLFVSFLVLILVTGAFFGALGLVIAVVIPKHLFAIALFKVSFNYFLSAAGALVMGPLVGGLYYVYLKTIRGVPTGASEIFAGFQKMFSQLLLGYLVVVLATGLCRIPFSYASAVKIDPLVMQMQNAQPTEIQNLLPQLVSAFTGILPILIVCLIPVTYLSVNWLFTQTLIIDKQMNFWPAMKTSWRKVHQHWWHLFGLVVVIGLLNLAGFAACCIGLLFTFPLSIAATMYAYETIFSAEKK